MNLYDKIFHVANSKMQSHQQEFSFGQAAFNSILYKNPNVISVDEFIALAPEEFLNAVYLRCLNRLPDALARKQVEDLNVDVPEYERLAQYKILMRVSRSAEFRALNKQVSGLKEMRKELLANGSRKLKWIIRAEEFKAGVRYVIKTFLIFPIWKRLSMDTKVKIKSLIIREK